MPGDRHQKHLLLNTPAEKEHYTSPRGGSSRDFQLFQRNRETHAQNLREQLEGAQRANQAFTERRTQLAVRGDFGIYLEFESEPNVPLRFESLEDLRSGIELQNVKESGGITYATVYVPEGKLPSFFRKIERYRTENYAQTDEPKNQKLLANIARIRLATLKAFWTDLDDFENIPLGEERWWEVWLRAGNEPEERETILQTFREVGRAEEIQIPATRIDFPERTVVLARASKNQLSNSVILLNCLAEIRSLRDTAETFMRMPIQEQREWVDELRARTTPASRESPSVCLLDQGVNNGHPLLDRSLQNSDMHTYIPAWGVNDTHPEGHGTGMAGLALYGDLFAVLGHNQPVALSHCLESVKMIESGHPHPPELYGDVTRECISRAEIEAPFRERAICLTVSSADGRFRGLPTSWSSAVDQIVSGAAEENEPKRLLLIAAGNTEFAHFPDYPNRNDLEGIHDPGQAWNAITVGASTDKDQIDPTTRPGWLPLAGRGSMCPASTTSLVWDDNWPIKPEVVLEGGNAAREVATGVVDYVDSLQLLTTHKDHRTRLFSLTGDTSAATAQAARMCAILKASYHEFWPETIRGLLVHSATWTPAMVQGVDLGRTVQGEKKNVLRRYGYGVPDLESALWSAENALTLIAQDNLKPFREHGNDIATDEVNLHALPWPIEALQELAAQQVELRVTLSYFVGPNPTHRKYSSRFDYASHGLRFDLKGATESLNDFRRRINRVARLEVNDFAGASSPINWVLGPNLRNRGSIHSDIWRGSAADLAEMRSVAVFPVTGWWKTRKHLGKWNETVRYSLIITIRTEAQDVDLYTPVLNQIRAAVTVGI